jgi:mannan endo-1,4-beta-mannosidase
MKWSLARVLKTVFVWFRDPLAFLRGATTLEVRGRFLFDTAGNKIVLRGINLPVLDDWAFPGSDRLAEVEQTGANVVRLEWYVHYPGPGRPAYALADLDRLLAKCAANRMIAIVELHDYTCEADAELVNTGLIPWWTSRAVVDVLNRHRRYLIVNLANELGSYRWADPPAAGLNAYKAAYKRAITAVRNAGLDMPIMIDAPDCGTSIHAFTSIGQELIDHDPKRNLLLSAHAYWADPGFDGQAEIAKAVAANLPIVFGEIANKQAEGADECHYDLDGTAENHPPVAGPGGMPFTYQALLTSLGQREIGWLAWSWWKDSCPNRQMTSTGAYANLTPYGNDLVNNTTYGLRQGTFHATRTPTLP